MLTSGLDSIPRNFGSDAADEARKIALAEAQLKKATDAITPAHKLDGRFGAVEENRGLLERQIRVAKLANTCSKALDAIRKSHDKGTLATDAQFKALATATAALEAAKAEGFEPVVTFFQQQGVELKAQNAAVAARGAQQAAEREAQANRERSQGVLLALQQKEEALHAWLTANPQGAIPADLLAQFDAAIAAAKANKAPVAWYERQRVQLAVADAFRLDDQAAFAAVARALNGELVASGFNKQKAFSTKFNVKKDFCYLAVMRFGTASGTERLENLAFHGPAANTGVQEFYVSPRSEVWQGMRGVCATQAGAVTVDGDATFAGTKNGIRFTVVAWPRADVPAYVAQQVNVVAGDLCDTQAWKNLWTNPVPGSLVYVDKEPYLVSSTDQGWSTLWTATARPTRAQTRTWSAEPPKTRTFATQLSVPACPRTPYATHADSVRLSKCHDAIDKRYRSAFEAAGRERDEARTQGALNAALGKLQRLSDQDNRDRRKECDPMAAAIAKKWEKTFNEVVDYYVDNEVKPTHPRIVE